MSRTYRRKNETRDYDWVLRDFFSLKELPSVSDYEKIQLYHSKYVWVHFSKWSDRGKKLIRKYHSDAGTTNHKEPGPCWFRNAFVERPNRRKSNREIKKFMLDTEYEVIIDSKPPLKYWT